MNGLFRDNYLSLELVHSMKGTDAWFLMFMKPFLSQCSSAKCDMLSLILSRLILIECLNVAFLAEQIVNVLLPIEFGCDRKRDFLFYF